LVVWWFDSFSMSAGNVSAFLRAPEGRIMVAPNKPRRGEILIRNQK